MSKKSKFKRDGMVHAYDEKHTGQEPVWNGNEHADEAEMQIKLLGALNFYAYYLDHDDYKNFIMEYMVMNGYSADDIKKVRRLGKEVSVATEGKLARMISLGMPAKTRGKNYKLVIDSKIASIIRYMSQEHTKPTETEESKKKTVKAKPLSPMKRLEDKVNATVISEIEFAMDNWSDDPTTIASVPITQLMSANDIPSKGCIFITQYVDRFLADANDAKSGDCEQCVEAYSFLTKVQLNKWIRTLTKIKDDVAKYEIANKKAIVRAKKTKPAIKQVEKIKYLTDNDDIKSVPPVRICGAMVLYTYNVKTRKLTKYQSLTRGGLSVKGTSIKDFDESKSYTFTVREKVYANILSALKKKDVVKALDSIKESTKTKITVPNGRSNEHTLLIYTK